MEQETKITINEILKRLAKLQAEVNFIKSQINFEKINLEEEMKTWEEASEEDILNW